MHEPEPDYVEEVDPALLPPYRPIKRERVPEPVELLASSRVEVPGSAGYEVLVRTYSDGSTRIQVQLPHQCDEFVVADGMNLEQILAELEDFVAQTKGVITTIRGAL